ncbi:hypothetical protein [Leisingera daeponensis]|uniref:hypothetical protein n=1 Tax=Leisingera daeponensis TaxID=405746 RepID=UPI001C944D0F|nr:hypothetical protein [Leisingera daeponensis]MBY6059139.1 hypothetical protein [Leisingera daeponensis]
MRPRGSSYKIVAVHNPLGRFPSRVFPIFQLSSETGPSGRLFQQIISSDGKIEDFLELKKPNVERLIFTNDGNRLSFVDQLALHCFAHREGEIFIARGLSEFSQYFRELMSEDRYREIRDHPLCAVELARFVDDEEYEAKFTKIATKKLAKRSINVAEGWLNYSQLSDPARQAGFEVLEKIKKEKFSFEEAKDIRSIQMGEGTFYQGDFVRQLWDGKIHIRIGKRLFKGKPVQSLRQG